MNLDFFYQSKCLRDNLIPKSLKEALSRGVGVEEGLGGGKGGGHGIITMFTVGSRQVVFMIFAVVLVYILNL